MQRARPPWNPNSLAVKLDRKGIQSSVQRFLKDGRGLSIKTSMPVAQLLGVPPEVFHDEKKATAYAKVHNLAPVPIPQAKPRLRDGAAGFAAPILARIIAMVQRGEPIGDDAPPNERKAHRAFEKAYRELLASDPDGPTGSTRPASLEEPTRGAGRMRSRNSTFSDLDAIRDAKKKKGNG